MTLRGTVEDIIYRNEDNGYTVINFGADGKLITAVGIFPVIGEGETLAISGEYKMNPKFGEQFVVDDVEFLRPDDDEGIIRYLGSGLFQGVGEATAEAIVRVFGKYTLDVIENAPEKLLSVNGIGRKKAADIAASYIESKKMKDSLIFLGKCGISTLTGIKIYKFYEDKTIETVKENPYRLIEDIDGVGFLTADKIAEKLGIDRDSDFRFTAGLIYILKNAAAKSGHTYLPAETLLELAGETLNTDERERLLNLIRTSPYQLKTTETDGITAVSTVQNYFAESGIAAKLVSLHSSVIPVANDVSGEISQYETTNNIVLHGKQREAVECAVSNGVTIITGGPGTGKTTIIKCITSIFSQMGLKVALTAPTGRASKRMSEATGEDAKTIHRLLNITGRDMPLKFTPLDCDVIIVDEISMADIYIFNALLKAMRAGSRLILVGDKDQLPSVSCGNILADCIASGLFPIVFLTEIYRQAKESMIIINAHRINNGEMPVAKKDSDFFIDPKKDSDEILSSVLTMVTSRIPNYLKCSPKDIQVLAPLKKGKAGVENLNRELQAALNPYGEELVFGDTVFRKGDKVMQTVNNYLLGWERNAGTYFESGNGVFNGDIGFIIGVKDNSLVVEFEDGKVCSYGGADIGELMLAYCISVHKSQGCEFPVSIIAVTSGNYAILTKNLLYTAVTRAKELAVIVGSEENIAKMVNNKYTEKRYSLLANLISVNAEKHNRLWN